MCNRKFILIKYFVSCNRRFERNSKTNNSQAQSFLVKNWISELKFNQNYLKIKTFLQIKIILKINFMSLGGVFYDISIIYYSVKIHHSNFD